MRLRHLVALAALFVSAPAGAQTITDDSDRRLTPAQRQEFIDGARILFDDPARIELRKLYVGYTGMLCGEASEPPKRGHRKVWAPFYVDLPHKNGVFAIYRGDLGLSSQLMHMQIQQCAL